MRSRESGSTCSSNTLQRSVDLALRAAAEQPACGRHDPSRIVGVVRRDDDRHVLVEPSHEPNHLVTRSVTAVEHDARQRREALGGMSCRERHEHLRTITRSDAELAVEQPLEHMLDVHPTHQHVLGLAVQHRLVAEEHLAVEGGHQVRNEGCRQQRHLGQRPRRPAELGQPVADSDELLGVAPVGDHTDRRGMRLGELGDGDLDDLGHIVGHPLERAHDEQHRCAQIGGDTGIERELGRTGDVGVVRSDDDHDLAGALDRPIPLDDRRQGGIRVGVHVLVRHAHARLVAEVGADLLEEQLHHLVVARGRAGYGTEHPDVPHTARQQVDQAQRHDRLPGVPFR